MQLRVNRAEVQPQGPGTRRAGSHRPRSGRGRGHQHHPAVGWAERHRPRLRAGARRGRPRKDPPREPDVRRALHLVPEQGGRAVAFALMSRDFALILAARLLRAFGFGLAAVLVGLHLERRGLSAGAIGLVLTVGLLSAAIAGVIAATISSRIGRRYTLAGAGVLIALAGLDLPLATSPLLLRLAAATRTPAPPSI